MSIAISEVFYSLQGEGKTIGHPAVFVRLGGCNLMCGGNGTQFDNELHNEATWRCDTIEVWMNAQKKSYNEVFDKECIEAIQNGANIVITGGEPMLQQLAILGLINHIRKEIMFTAFIEVETNGTIMPIDELIHEVGQWNVSPKLSNSGNDKSIRFNKNVLWRISGLNTQFKFVISNEEDWEEVQTDFDFISRPQTYLMPAGSSQQELEQTKLLVAELCKKNFVRMTDRMHINIWNKKTGV